MTNTPEFFLKVVVQFLRKRLKGCDIETEYHHNRSTGEIRIFSYLLNFRYSITITDMERCIMIGEITAYGISNEILDGMRKKLHNMIFTA